MELAQGCMRACSGAAAHPKQPKHPRQHHAKNAAQELHRCPPPRHALPDSCAKMFMHLYRRRKQALQKEGRSAQENQERASFARDAHRSKQSLRLCYSYHLRLGPITVLELRESMDSRVYQ
jgi:hypothetical protein